MPVFNGEAFLAEAIESILKQSFSDFEFVIVNDGSTDNSAEIVERFAANDHRIKLHHMNENSGIVEALNTGVQHSSGKYIARMDADDISLPDRLEEQVRFLDRTDVGVIGANYFKFSGHSSRNNGKLSNLPTTPEDLQKAMLYTCSLGHPVVTFRRTVFDQVNGYDTHYSKGGAEDYDLWLRMSRHCKQANLDLVLLRYRRHKNSLTAAAKEADKYTYNSACTIANHFAFLYELEGVFPIDGPTRISKTLLDALIKSRDPWHQKCLKRWILRFTRYCVSDSRLRHENKRVVFRYASPKEKAKWFLYRLV